ncbi:hypothetical protein RND71_016929 [Anisodus tanguticus]|uniref:RING-type domain-containing protein n=1 Tax=Anisodus tanguticus TaxID=243964 RepID=A0AAE1SAQ7_9SOLA|nr:hypothetical protein RND71_016929 [Anisodus tanguticus]
MEPSQIHGDTRLGLYEPPPEDDGYNPNSYILLLDGTCPSLRGRHLRRQAQSYRLRRGNDEWMKGCSICLESMELEEEIRELITCNHVFHRGCLDTWVNDGHVTCPSMLLPPKDFKTGVLS